MPSWSSRDKYFWAARRQYDNFILSSRLSRGSFHHAGQEARNENDSNSDTESDMGNVGNPVIDASDLSRRTFVGCAVTAAATVTATAMPQPTSLQEGYISLHPYNLPRTTSQAHNQDHYKFKN